MTRADRLLQFVTDLEEMADKVERAVLGDAASRRWLAGQTDASGRIVVETMAPSWPELDSENES